MLRVSLLIFVWINPLNGCIPTQNVDSNGGTPGSPGAPGTATTTTTTTTTVATTTTTVTEAPFPCNVCQKVYDNTCQGFGIPNLLQWCPTAAEAAIEYTLGFLQTVFPIIPANSCATVITCPLTTALRIKILGAEIPAPVLYAWCEESGPRAGKWYTGATVLLSVELVSLACRPII
ncbi:hypothetical protein L5515_017982 [Caenorhabditis briggsae]|uniref:Uncharacterized protein n=1 Tax=Caenorhabditis briggsae TaxID=6238 RepID=A0AAE9CUU6_CAEBR|nr:hypothetical protein L3Y34_012123 [Caenorhabditis briggsae]UMM41959.1 hypothetical protein L5515_017982 [Caenorhabditis briggsae]